MTKDFVKTTVDSKFLKIYGAKFGKTCFFKIQGASEITSMSC